jgi:hypothetical protein
MESDGEDGFQSSRLIFKNNLILEPITKSAKEFLEIINNPKNQKGVFVKINTQLYNNYFGPSVSPNTKKKLEKEKIARGEGPFVTKTPEEIEKFKTKSKDLGAQIKGKNIIFIPNEVNTIGSIKSALKTIFKNANLEEETDYILKES